MAAGIRNVLIRFQGETKGLEQASGNANKQLEKGRAAFGKVGKAATVASGLIVGAFAVWAKGAIGAAEEGLAAERALANVFKQMGGGASEAFKQAGDAAKSIGKDLAIPATEITNVQTKLATFGKIWDDPVKGAENFNRASTLAFDLAAAGFGSADSNAAQLGKALQDPTKGMTALARSGVTFSEAEKEKIKALQESGDLLAAQEMIYGALEKQVGGTAKASVTDSQRMQVAIGELSESFGRMLLPAVKVVGEWVQKLTTWMEDNQRTVAIVASVLVGLAAAVLAVNVALKLWQAAVVVATAVQWLWNIAMSANPLGFIIIVIVAVVAALVVLYTQSETARKIIDGVFRAIVAVVKWWWENIVKRYIAGVVAGFQFVVAWAKNLWKGVQLYFGFWKGLLEKVIGWVIGAKDRIVAGFNLVVDFVKKIPGRVRTALSGLGNAIAAPFKAGFGAARDFYNSVLGGKGFDIPSWVPGLAGKSFRFPKFHQGGIIPGPAGREVPIIARAGERVLTEQQQDDLSGGTFEGTLVLDSGEFLGVVTGIIGRANRNTRRRVTAGAGAAR